MDLLIVSLLLSVLAVAVSILVFLDNRNKTRIMNEQLRLLKEETESKQEIRNAIKVVDSLTEGIAKVDTSGYDWGDFGGIVYIRLLEALHDSGKNSLIWNVRIESIFNRRLDTLPKFDSFRRFFEESMHNGRDTRLVFSSSPDVEVSDIDIEDYLRDLYFILQMHENLKPIEKTVNLFDPDLSSGILAIYVTMLKTFYVAITDEIRLVISSEIKTTELPDHLLKIIAFDTWQECVSNLKKNVIPRLYKAKRQMLESL